MAFFADIIADATGKTGHRSVLRDPEASRIPPTPYDMPDATPGLMDPDQQTENKSNPATSNGFRAESAVNKSPRVPPSTTPTKPMPINVDSKDRPMPSPPNQSIEKEEQSPQEAIQHETQPDKLISRKADAQPATPNRQADARTPSEHQLSSDPVSPDPISTGPVSNGPATNINLQYLNSMSDNLAELALKKTNAPSRVIGELNQENGGDPMLHHPAADAFSVAEHVTTQTHSHRGYHSQQEGAIDTSTHYRDADPFQPNINPPIPEAVHVEAHHEKAMPQERPGDPEVREPQRISENTRQALHAPHMLTQHTLSTRDTARPPNVHIGRVDITVQNNQPSKRAPAAHPQISPGRRYMGGL